MTETAGTITIRLDNADSDGPEYRNIALTPTVLRGIAMLLEHSEDCGDGSAEIVRTRPSADPMSEGEFRDLIRNTYDDENETGNKAVAIIQRNAYQEVLTTRVGEERASAWMNR